MTLPTRGAFLRRAGAAAAAASLVPSTALARRAPTDADVSKLYDAAKREGTVTWWTSQYTLGAAQNIRDAFRAKYPGIDVTVLRQPTQVIDERVLQDFKAGVRECDVVATTDELHYSELKKLGALLSHVPPDLDKIPPQFQRLDPDETYQLGALGFVVLNYNPKSVTPAPKRWPELLDSKWRNQVSLGHPGFSGYVAFWAMMLTQRYGWDNYFKKLAENKPKIGRSIFEVTTDIVSGERQIGAGADKAALEAKAKGSSIDIAFPQDDAVLIAAPTAVLKNAPHPNAARLFANFYYSKEFSRAIVKTFDYPLRADVRSANGLELSRVKYKRITLDQQVTGLPEVVAKWRETFGV